MRLGKFYENMQQDLKLFFFLLFLISAYRMWFMWQMSGYMGDGATADEIATALWAGLRLSLKTAGALTLPAYISAFAAEALPAYCALTKGAFATVSFSSPQPAVKSRMATAKRAVLCFHSHTKRLPPYQISYIIGTNLSQ